MDQPEPSIAGTGTNGHPRSLLELGLRGPTLGVLQRQGVLSVDQLVEMSPEDLMGLRRVGLSRMLEVRKALQAHGLDLQMDVEESAPRPWAVIQRLRLVCCERGECVLELRSTGASAQRTESVVQAFVDAHRACERLDGRAPAVARAESSQSS